MDERQWGDPQIDLPIRFSSQFLSDWRRTSIYPLVWRPPTDVFETEIAVIVRIEIAGMKENEFEIAFQNNVLTVRGARLDQSIPHAFYQMEIPFGEFRTDMEIPCPVNIESASAEYTNGFLHIILPKIEPTHIRVE